MCHRLIIKSNLVGSIVFNMNAAAAGQMNYVMRLIKLHNSSTRGNETK